MFKVKKIQWVYFAIKKKNFKKYSKLLKIGSTSDHMKNPEYPHNRKT